MNVKLLNFIEKQDNYLDFSIFVSILDGGGRHRRHHGRGGGGIRCIRRIKAGVRGDKWRERRPVRAAAPLKTL